MKWNKKYNERLMKSQQNRVNERLQKFVPYFKGGEALDVACGLGANSFFLAKLNYQVEAIDISDVAINHVRIQAQQEQLPIQTTVTDLTDRQTFYERKAMFDLIIVTYYLDRSILPFLLDCLKENGYFFMETFYQLPIGKNAVNINKNYKLKPAELLKLFSDWHVLFYEENEAEERQTIFFRKSKL